MGDSSRVAPETVMVANHDTYPFTAVFAGKLDAIERRTSSLGTSCGEQRRQDVVGVTRS